MGNPVQNRIQIPVQKELKKICEKFQIKFLILFGSQASKKTHKESDVDIAIYPEGKKFEKNTHAFEEKLAKIFKNPNIDLINLKTTGPLLQREVVTNGKLLYAMDKESFSLFQMYAISAYYEFEPYLKLREKMIGKNIKTLIHSK